MARSRHSVAGAVKRAVVKDDRERGKATTVRRVATHDSFVNYAQRVGRASGSPSARGSYALYPLTRFRIELEWAYRSSWIVRAAVDAVADDMVRAGIDLGSDLEPKDSDRLLRGINTDGTWRQLNQALKWGRLYGGAIAVPVIDGQDYSKELRVDRIAKGQYKGIVVLDRWQLFPSYEDLVTANDAVESTDEIGLPRFYRVTANAQALPGQKIHFSRAWRLSGVAIPYWQRLTENLWDLSVIEPLYDRLIAFDSATQGAAQLVYRAYLRTLKLKGLTDILGQEQESPAHQALINRTTAIRELQASEGLTIIDAEDALEFQTYTFSGLSDILIQFGQQIAGSTGIPLVRLFGQAPAGLQSTGESDWRNYEQNVGHTQELQLRMPVSRILRLKAKSTGIELPEDFWWDFSPLYQMTDQEKAAVGQSVTQTVSEALERGVITKRVTGLRELKQSSRQTGIWTNITNEDIKEAESEPEIGQGGMAPEPEIGGEEPGGLEEEEQQQRGNLPAPRAEEMDRPRLRLVGDADPTRGFDLHGLPIFIETAAGEYRTGKGWRQKMPDGVSYGYIRMTGSAEGPAEGTDCFIGPDRDSKRVWIVNQVVPETGAFDEPKLMLAFGRRDRAIKAYLDSYGGFEKAAARLGSVRDMDIPRLMTWLETHPVTEAA